jgi:hypothetical protein
MVICGSSCLRRRRIVRPWFGTAQVEWRLAIVVARYVVGKRCRFGRGTIHQHAYVSICCDCCARAVNGHAAPAPPSSVMNSLRLMSAIDLSPFFCRLG